MNETSDKIAVKACVIKKTYKLGLNLIDVLRGVDLEIAKGSWTALLGSSGSGKTTLLNIIAGLERPDSGTLHIDGQDTSSRKKSELNKFRRTHIGMVFQAYYLIPELSTLENVILPALINGCSREKAKARAEKLLVMVGLKDRLSHRPLELSGGEQQRAAIARALMNEPKLLLADEPTGNLDSKTGEQVLLTICELRKEGFADTILMVTHNADVASLADRILHLKDGKIVN